MTLLHYIVRTYMKRCEDPLSSDLALPVPEPGDIDRAAAVQFEDIEGQLHNLDKELNGIIYHLILQFSLGESNVHVMVLPLVYLTIVLYFKSTCAQTTFFHTDSALVMSDGKQ